MEETEILKKAVDTLEQKPIAFEIDFTDFLGRKKVRSFEVKPLTLSQLCRISKLVIDIDPRDKDTTIHMLYELIRDHTKTCAEIIAIAVTESKKTQSKKLIEFFYNNLDHSDLSTALTIIWQQMDILPFINTMASIKNLSILERKPAGVKNAGKKEEKASPQVPGDLSVAS